MRVENVAVVEQERIRNVVRDRLVDFAKKGNSLLLVEFGTRVIDHFVNSGVLVADEVQNDQGIIELK